MRPDFEYMTTAELRVYCSYVHKAAKNSFQTLQKISNYFDGLDCSNQLLRDLNGKVKNSIKQFEVVGLDDD